MYKYTINFYLLLFYNCYIIIIVIYDLKLYLYNYYKFISNQKNIVNF